MTTAPKMLGRYELLELLGEGGMGAVWLARLTGAGGFEKLCIVKTVLPSIASDQQFVSRFQHEGRVLTQLQHSNIAQVHDMAEDAGTLFLALEYVSGVDLTRLHTQVQNLGQVLPVPVAVFIMQQAAEGLGFAHRKANHDGAPLNIVHRDVSPQNIMVSYEGEVKVIDFGISKSEARSHHTAQASVMGKLGYMAPEQARGESVDHRADQYACALVLWELLTNAPYVNRGTITEMVVAMANPPPVKKLTPLRPEVPPLLEQEVLKALNPDRNQRFPTTDDFANALQGVLVQMGGIPSHLQVGEYVRTHCTAEYKAQQALITRVHTARAPLPLTNGQALTQRHQEEPNLDSTAVRPATPLPQQATPAASARAPLATPAAAQQQPPEELFPPPNQRPQSQSPLQPQSPPQPQRAQNLPVNPPPARPAPKPFPNPLDDAGPAQPRMSTAELQSAGIKSNGKTLLFVALGGIALFGLLAVAGGAYWFLTQRQGAVAKMAEAARGGTPPLPTTPAPPTQPGPAVGTRPAVPAPTPTGAPGAAPPPNDAPAVAAPPPVADDVKGTPPPPPAAGPLEAAEFVVGVYPQGSGFALHVGQDLGLKVGQALAILGAEAQPGRRPRLGSATVTEVLPNSARVELDAAAAAASGERVASIPPDRSGQTPPPGAADVRGTPPPPPPGTADVRGAPPPPPPGTADVRGAPPPPPPATVAAEPAERTAEVYRAGNNLFVRAGKDVGLRTGQTLVVLGAETTPGLRPRLGTATILEAFPTSSMVRLDPGAAAATGERVAALPDRQASAPPLPTSGTPPGGKNRVRPPPPPPPPLRR